MSIILATQEADIEGSQFEASQANNLEDPILKKKKKKITKKLLEWLKVRS
jgi:hypothetical protein